MQPGGQDMLSIVTASQYCQKLHNCSPEVWTPGIASAIVIVSLCLRHSCVL